MIAQAVNYSNLIMRYAAIIVMFAASVLLCLFSDAPQAGHRTNQNVWNDHSESCSNTPEFCQSIPQQLQSGNLRRSRCNSGFRSFPVGTETLRTEEVIFIDDTLHQNAVPEDICFTYHSYSRCAIPVRAGPDAC